MSGAGEPTSLTVAEIRDAAVTLRAAHVEVIPDPETEGVDIADQLADLLEAIADRCAGGGISYAPETRALITLVDGIQSVTR